MKDWFILIGVVSAFSLGWVLAHRTVSTECERLGAFYVGEAVYECRAKGRAQAPSLKASESPSPSSQPAQAPPQ